jgi:hypothetical protein
MRITGTKGPILGIGLRVARRSAVDDPCATLVTPAERASGTAKMPGADDALVGV